MCDPLLFIQGKVRLISSATDTEKLPLPEEMECGNDANLTDLTATEN